MDADVVRLRGLRDRAHAVRAVAMAMQSETMPFNSTLSRSAQICWRISRIVTGQLRAHPNLSHRQDYSLLRGAFARLRAGTLASFARIRGTPAQAVAVELKRIARELDDVRALTWSAELSDALGRVQLQMRRLRQDLEAAAQLEAGLLDTAPALLESAVTRGRKASKDAANWPYLAI